MYSLILVCNVLPMCAHPVGGQVLLIAPGVVLFQSAKYLLLLLFISAENCKKAGIFLQNKLQTLECTVHRIA
jgi:hypothetical protein